MGTVTVLVEIVMKSVVAAIAVSLMLGSAAAWADNDDGRHGRHAKHWSKQAEKEWKRERKHWEKHQRHAEKHHHFDRRDVVHHYPVPRVREHHYYYAEPVAVYSPPPGVHVVMPNVYIPF